MAWPYCGRAVHTPCWAAWLARHLQRSAVIAAALAVTGCAAISEEECFTTDWYQRGVADGNSGLPASRVDSYTQVCSKVGVNVNTVQWQGGRRNGLKQYCTPERGREEGLRGRQYQQVCPAGLEAGFLAAYRAGYQVYETEREIDRIQSRIRQKEYELKKSNSSKERLRLRNTIRNLDRRAADERDRMYQAERALRQGRY